MCIHLYSCEMIYTPNLYIIRGSFLHLVITKILGGARDSQGGKYPLPLKETLIMWVHLAFNLDPRAY